jgi:hypothetical protein
MIFDVPLESLIAIRNHWQEEWIRAFLKDDLEYASFAKAKKESYDSTIIK